MTDKQRLIQTRKKEMLLTEICGSQSGHVGKAEWLDKSERSPVDRAAYKPDS